jgi:geranylgeranyl diphosphate synthase type I
MSDSTPDVTSSDSSTNQLEAMTNAFTAAFADSVGQLRTRLAAVDGLQPADSLLAIFCQVPGKHVRPHLFLSAYPIFSDDSNLSEGLLAVACAQEHFHNFLLIHDDVIDSSTSRRGQPTLHEALRRKAGAREPEHIAIILGNILYSHALEGFLHPQLDPTTAREAMRYFLDIASDTGLGEALELLNLDRPINAVEESTILATYDLKTSRYTFEAPLGLAMILAGSHTPERLTVLRAFTRPIGIAFQIENDLHEIELDPELSVERAFDLMHGIKTLYLKRAFATANPDERERLKAFLQNPHGSAEACKAMLRWLQASPVRSQIRQAIADAFQQSRDLLDTASCFSTQEKNELHQLLDYIHAHRKHSESSEG